MASSAVQTWTYPTSEVTVVEIDFLCSAEGGHEGEFTSYALNAAGGLLFMGVTIPDAVTPPQASYDITILDANGVDIFGGELLNRSQTLSQQAVPSIGSVYGARFFNGVLTVAIAGNNVSGSKGKIFLYIMNELSDRR